MSRAKAKAKVQPTPRPKTAAERASAWSAGDRIGKITLPVLREARLRADLGLPLTDPDLISDVLALAAEILIAACDASAEPTLTLNEVADQVRSLEEIRARDVEESEDELRQARQDLDESRERFVELETEHDEQIQDWRRRTEKAEHDLAETVRRGHALDVEARGAQETLRTLRATLRTVLALDEADRG